MGSLKFQHLREQNLPRCRRWHPAGAPPWEFDDWLLALGGEAGEALNVIKKLNRDRDGLAGNSRNRGELVADLASELADCVIYLDILLGWNGSLLLLGAVDFDDRREIRRANDNLGPATASQLGNLMLKAVARIYPDDMRGSSMAAFNAIDRVADHFGIDLGSAVVAKFNATSDRFGFPERLVA